MSAMVAASLLTACVQQSRGDNCSKRVSIVEAETEAAERPRLKQETEEVSEEETEEASEEETEAALRRLEAETETEAARDTGSVSIFDCRSLFLFGYNQKVVKKS